MKQTARFGLALAIAIIGMLWHGQRIDSCPVPPHMLSAYVGVVEGKCCTPGRRWGCDPQNFNQSGCVPIGAAHQPCTATPRVTMQCTNASCTAAGPEDRCEVNIQRVTQNQCQPTGRMDTQGCPRNQWQCHVNLQSYLLPTAPSKDVLVCDRDVSTICPYTFNVCE
jgi:hypothetical protein